jgi:hypothetical protein
VIAGIDADNGSGDSLQVELTASTNLPPAPQSHRHLGDPRRYFKVTVRTDGEGLIYGVRVSWMAYAEDGNPG